jgi:hypothetical protein
MGPFFSLAHGQYLLRGGDVVPGSEGQRLLELEMISYLFGSGPEAESSAHDLRYQKKSPSFKLRLKKMNK